MESRKCRTCNEIKPLTEFHTAGIKNGVKYFRHKCKPCYQKGKAHRRHHNRQWMIDYKSTLKCQNCGYSKNTHSTFKTQALDFHHHNDDKEHTVSDMVHRGFSVKKIKKEIGKCTVLCARCHIEIHF